MRFALRHRHTPRECAVAYAAWRGFESPLRHEPTLATCGSEAHAEAADHMLMWTVEAESEQEALALLPPWLAERTEARGVVEVSIP